MEGVSRVTLQREGRRQELQRNQVTMENIRRLFQVDPAEAWLRDEYDDISYFPNDDGSFDLSNNTSFSTLMVEGPVISSANSRGATYLVPPSPSTAPLTTYLLLHLFVPS